MLAIQEYDSVLNAIYGSYTTKMNYMVSTIYINNAAEYTGTAASQTYLRSAIAENTTNTDNVNAGISLVDTNQGYVSDISQKLDEMKQLADDAAGGGYTAEELTDMQTQLEALADEIDDIAQGPLGETHILTADDQTESVFIGSGLSIQIETHDMNTTSGLGLSSIDVSTDPAAAVAALQAAITEVDDYAAHLDSKYDTLQAAAASLEVQGDALTAMESAIGSMDAAMIVVGMINAEATTITNLLIIAQANSIADTVLNLLAD